MKSYKKWKTRHALYTKYTSTKWYEWTCISCRYNDFERKNEVTKKCKKITFNNRVKYAQKQKLCICFDVYKLYEDNDFNWISEILSRKNLIKYSGNIPIETYVNLDKDFEQNYYSKTALDFYKIGHDSFRIKKSMSYYDKNYENFVYSGLLASLSNYSNDKP